MKLEIAWLRRKQRSDSAGSAPRTGSVAAATGGVVQQVNLRDVRADRDVNVNVLYAASLGPAPDVAEALIGDPLRLAGVDADVEQARQLRTDGNHLAAAELLVQAAATLEARGFGLIGEFSLEEAAEAFAEGGDRKRAAELVEEVVRRRLDRHDSRAEFGARRLERLLEDGEQWRSEAYLARVFWPEQPDACVAALAEAVGRTVGDPEELDWGSEFIGVLVTLGRNADAVDHGEQVRRRWPIEADAAVRPVRLRLELDYLSARVELEGLTEELDDAWDSLLASMEQSQPAVEPALMARLHQRRAVVLARCDRPADARAAFVRAIKEWNRQEGNDEQIKEAFFSLERAALVSGTWRAETQQTRVYASQLRGRDTSAATAAERLEREGLHARLSSQLPDALRAYWQAYALSREAGNFYEQLAAAELLAELYVTAGRQEEALPFLIAAGKEKEAKELAEQLPPDACLAAIRLRGPVWERTVSYAILEVAGDRLSDAQFADLTPPLIEAAQPPPTGLMWPQPSLRARGALATMAAGVPDDLLPAVVELLEADRSTPNANAATAALVRLTNLGRVDATAPVTDIVFGEGTLIPNPSVYFIWLGDRLNRYQALQEKVATLARQGHRGALETLAIADLIGDDPDLTHAIDRQVEAFLAHRGYEERTEDGRTVRTVHIGDNSGVGITARYCSAELRGPLVTRLVEIVEEDNEAETSRSSAADALYNFAGRLTADEALAALPPLLRVGRGEHGHSEFEAPAGPRDPLARHSFSWNTTGALRASALRAGARIAGGADLEVEELQGLGVEQALRLALETADGPLVSAALDGYAWLPALELPLTFTDAFSHPDPQVRRSAVRLFAQRGELPSFSELAVLAPADPDTNVRTSFSFLVAEQGANGRPLAAALADDEVAFIRQHARGQLQVLSAMANEAD
jgi:tetratricopeptide (TPR) repeat protein